MGIKITQCTGEGQGSCKMCSDNGKRNRTWMCFLYKIEGYDGCYCEELNSERNLMYREDGTLMGARTQISIDRAVDIVEKGGIE